MFQLMESQLIHEVYFVPNVLVCRLELFVLPISNWLTCWLLDLARIIKRHLLVEHDISFTIGDRKFPQSNICTGSHLHLENFSQYVLARALIEQEVRQRFPIF